MSDIDALIETWMRRLVEAEPELAAFTTEIEDHIRSACAGSTKSPEDAFREAVQAFGAPSELAADFVLASRRELSACTVAVVYLGASMVAATLMIVLHHMTLILLAWALLAFVPYTSWTQLRARREYRT